MSSSNKIDMVYMDPPYYSLHSDNEYVRRYHFVEGIACGWQGVEMQWNTKTKKFTPDLNLIPGINQIPSIEERNNGSSSSSNRTNF